ncbi:hypothetical protein SAMN05428642_101941 [Flaviramulus basaltis]|uniref:Uncharacterized protein n=1 Tax=Flaviramulus basaltis TaxID=369401 RepID=A0A1K2IDI3_9FLAO|nr:hypothetical protein [Flaviramulus basaltis]SFZ90447.1 hypothetical protein SAMN05428642_101941 [Flaviramulus basaltis]
MHKKTIAIFFNILLLALISAPSIIIAIDDSIDISMFYSVTEEEETSKIKLQSPDSFSESECIISCIDIEDVEYYFKKYPKPHLNLISPPPELHIL